ncbi:MAG TPA: PTS mannose transporter subunit IIA [Gammaproteobacteria bacterium]|nr:PTS mannose transporter subunit IIA [Gammaproteobacteria bacterium]HAU06735.1 PTS mannose transporter subunit IIA [Gammaproteobacteria bacterium]
MTVGVLIISHNQIGLELINTARQMLASYSLPAKVISIRVEDDRDTVKQKVLQTLKETDQGQGTLILTDMYGSTPSNIACDVSEQYDVRIVSGLNLPMLIRVLNYPLLDLGALETKALSGGKEGVARCHNSGFDE